MPRSNSVDSSSNSIQPSWVPNLSIVERSNLIKSNNAEARPPAYSLKPPEHLCDTTAEAFHIIKTLRLCPYEAFEEKYGPLIDSKVTTLSERQLEEIQDKADKILSTRHFEYWYVRGMVFAGQSFTFTNNEAGYAFCDAMEAELKKEHKTLSRRMRKLEMRVKFSEMNPLTKLKAVAGKEPPPYEDCV